MNPRIESLKDKNVRERMQGLFGSNRFPFIYNDVDGEDPYPDHDMKDFTPSQTVGIEF